ncbi:hypothetical protein [Roseobacter weihaiensis]|uniref:hypothetical protein n=1 Tax=Roseobacter weihaiensis TaxID=2763262 RepID=UPI001D09EC2F|nr:hypothetical protein [Roseobacter sp. H9]
MSLFEMPTLMAGVTETGGFGAAVKARSNIFDMTQAAEEAVLRPDECGAFPHDMRAALAARIAAQSGDRVLAEHHAKAAGAMAPLSDPTQDGTASHPVLIAFVDKAANATKDIAAEDITRLQSAGVGDADIVRLCELVAFVAYQLRVVAGLRLMQGGKT